MILIFTALIGVGGYLLALHYYLHPEQGEHGARARLREAEDKLVQSLRSVPIAQPHHGRHRPGAAGRPLLAIAAPVPLTEQVIPRHRAAGDPFTGELPKLTDDVLAEYQAEAHERQRRTDWAAMQLAALGDNATPEAVAGVLAGMRGEYRASYQAERGYYGTMPQLAAEQMAETRP